jgi:hypothetical protein
MQYTEPERREAIYSRDIPFSLLYYAAKWGGPQGSERFSVPFSGFADLRNLWLKAASDRLKMVSGGGRLCLFDRTTEKSVPWAYRHIGGGTEATPVPKRASKW